MNILEQITNYSISTQYIAVKLTSAEVTPMNGRFLSSPLYPDLLHP